MGKQFSSLAPMAAASGLVVMALMGYPLLAEGAKAKAKGKEFPVRTSWPKHTYWGTLQRSWNRALKQGGGKRLRLRFETLASPQGERAQIAKLLKPDAKAAGAMVSVRGLAHVWGPAFFLESPAMGKTSADLPAEAPLVMGGGRRAFRKQGLRLLGLYYGGQKRLYGTAPLGGGPRAIAKFEVIAPFDDPVATALFSGAEGKPLKFHRRSRPGSLGLLLGAKRPTVIEATSLELAARQWTPHLRHRLDVVTRKEVWALVVREKAVRRLAKDERKILLRSAKKGAAIVSNRIEAAEQRMSKRLSHRITTNPLLAPERQAWENRFRQAHQALKPLGPGLFKRLPRP